MYESSIRSSKVSIFPGNILKAEADLLVLYEKTSHSRVYNRVFSSFDVKTPFKQEFVREVLVKLYRTSKRAYRRVLVIDKIDDSKPITFQAMEDIVKWILSYIGDPKPVKELPPNPANNLPQEGYKISFNLTETQDSDNLKSLIDKLITIRPVLAILAGTPKDINHMLSYINQSGHLLSNISINTPEVISSFFQMLSCANCKKFDENCRFDSQYSKLYCKQCALMQSAHQVSNYVPGIIHGLKDTCYCGKPYLLGERDKHLSDCNTAVYCCQDCAYYGGQVDFAKHFIENHTKRLVDNLDAVVNVKVSSHFKKQCPVCGSFYEVQNICHTCAKHEQEAKRVSK